MTVHLVISQKHCVYIHRICIWLWPTLGVCLLQQACKEGEPRLLTCVCVTQILHCAVGSSGPVQVGTLFVGFRAYYIITLIHYYYIITLLHYGVGTLFVGLTS